MTLSQQAQPQATQLYAAAFLDLTYQPFGQIPWLVSQAGFGCYRVDTSVGAHREALAYALQRGINLIDTSSNYADGGSEQLVGQVLADLTREVTREAVVVVSKVGYLQGQNYALSQERKAAGRPFPDLVEYAPGLEHCLHPDFLTDQLTRSLERLDMAVIDCYLLHNPEYFLSWAYKHGVPLAEARESYYQRIGLAFAHLEGEVAHGRIQYYGISSNTFPAPANDPQFTSLTHCWQLAEAISPDHHFRVIQLPLNLLETGGATEMNQPNGHSVLDFAYEKGLAVLINRPLNAFYNNTLMRLATIPRPEQVVSPAEVSTAVARLVQLEVEFQQKLLPLLIPERDIRQQLGVLLRVGMALDGRWSGFGSYINWQEILAQHLLPRTQGAVHILSNLPNLPSELRNWLDHYVVLFNETIAAIGTIYQDSTATWAELTRQMVGQVDNEWQAKGLSGTAIRALRSTEGITSVLVGMRQKAYIEDVLAELSLPITRQKRTPSWQKLAQGI
jgi:aryl-alcohol dehydrogenase-like predicted oxidoreductase